METFKAKVAEKKGEEFGGGGGDEGGEEGGEKGGGAEEFFCEGVARGGVSGLGGDGFGEVKGEGLWGGVFVGSFLGLGREEGCREGL